MKRTILITGGAGFIGSNLCRFWKKRYPEDRLVVLDKLTYAGNPANLEPFGLKTTPKNQPLSYADKRFRFEQCDITNITDVDDVFQTEDIDLVFHLAAESHVDRSIKDPSVFIDTNVKGTFVMLEACMKTAHKHKDRSAGRKQKPRFIHISTDEVFGSLSPEDPPFTESSPYRPNSPYSASKAASDHLVRAYNKTYGLCCLTTNCSNNYGPFQYPEKLIPLMIHNITNKIPLPVYGDGENVRDWINVEDHCRALAKVALEGASGDTFNIGAGEEKRNIDIVRKLCDLVDIMLNRPKGESRNLIQFVKDRAGHDRRYAVDSSKIRKKLRWEPKTTFDKGLEDTVQWYLKEELKENY